MMGYGYMGMMGMWIPMLVGLLLLIALVVAVVVIAIRLTASRGQTPPTVPPNAAQQILATRYARGEIDTDEYLARLHTLEAGQS